MVTKKSIQVHQYVPPNVPIEGKRVEQILERLKTEMPDEVEQAVRELGLRRYR